MKASAARIAAAVALVGASLAPAGAGLPSPLAMPFLCLERCNSTSAEIHATIAQVGATSAMLGGVATERYNLGEGGRLVVGSDLTDSLPLLRAAGWPSGAPIIAMVSSYPYPPQFATWMREVFADPQPFVEQLVSEASQHGIAGFNIDWEPLSSTVQPGDAAAYAKFLGALGRALAPHGLSVTVDVATWSPLWSFPDLNATALPFIDGIMSMSTYTDSQGSWDHHLAEAIDAFGASGKLIVGLETTRINGTAYPEAQLRQRFDALKEAGMRRVGLWRAPVPSEWDSFLKGL